MIAKKITGLAVSLLFITASCEYEPQLSMEERLDGRWSFTKVTFKKSWSFKKEDWSDQYYDQTLRIHDYGALMRIKSTTADTCDGSWDITTETKCDSDGDTYTVNHLSGHLTNRRSSETEYFSYEICKLTNDKFHFVDDVEEGRVIYNAIKL